MPLANSKPASTSSSTESNGRGLLRALCNVIHYVVHAMIARYRFECRRGILVDTVDTLFDRFASAAVSDATLVTVTFTRLFALASMRSDAEEPAAMPEANVHVTVRPGEVQDQPAPRLRTNVTPSGRVSTTETGPLAIDGERLVTLIS
jgi:hypothetical protein